MLLTSMIGVPDILLNWRARSLSPSMKMKWLRTSTEGVAKFWRSTRTRVVGLNWFDRFLAPSIREKVRKEFHQVLEGSTAKPEHYESEFLTARGKIRTITWHNLLQFDEPGKVAGTICVGIDVTERLDEESNLARKRSQAQMILHANPDLFFHLTSDGTIIDYECVDTENLLLNPHDFLNKRMQDVLNDDVGKMYDDAIGKVQSTGTPTTIEYLLKMRNGGQWFEARVLPYQDEDIVLIVRDITDRRRTEEQLRENLNQLAHVTRLHSIGEMATGFAHELNQPLGAILLYSSEGQQTLASEDQPDLDQLRELFTRVSRMAELGGGIIHRLRRLAVSAPQEKADFAITDLCNDVLNLMEFELRKRRIEVETQFDSGRLTVHVDEIQFHQVLLNLIRNALDAMAATPPAERTLRIVARKVWR